MTDPFQNVSAAGPDFIEIIAQSLENRAVDPAMVPIIEAYLDEIDWTGIRRAAEVGSGTGPVTRMMAARAPDAEICGYEPSPELVERARTLAAGIGNLAFEVADGAALPVAEASLDLVVMHTVLSHVPAPESLLAEAARALAPGGTLVVCDADFSKGALGNFPGDPLQSCANVFTLNFVTDRNLVGRLRQLVAAHGFRTRSFRVANRLTTDNANLAIWPLLAGRHMVERGQIGQDLADALLAEHDRRLREGTLYGFQPFATLIADARA